MPPCLAHYPDTDVRTNAARVPFTRLLFAVVPLREHALPSLCHRAEPSPPSLPPCTGLHCPHAKRGYKRRPPLRLVHTHVGSASGKPSPQHLPLFSAASLVSSHLTPPLSPYAGPRASPKPRAAPQPEGPAPSLLLSSGTVDRAGEFRPSVACLPRCEQGLSTVSGESTVGWGSLRCTPC
jgi:hypothetical protein